MRRIRLSAQSDLGSDSLPKEGRGGEEDSTQRTDISEERWSSTNLFAVADLPACEGGLWLYTQLLLNDQQACFGQTHQRPILSANLFGLLFAIQ